MKSRQPKPAKTPGSTVGSGGPVGADRAKELLEKDLENLARKVRSGVVLTAGERRLLNSTLHAVPASPHAATYAANQVELSKALGVTRQTVHRWLREAGNPGRRPDGRYSVSDWITWRDSRGGAAAPGVADLKVQLIEAQVAKIHHSLAVARGEYVPRVDVEKWGGELGAAVRKVVTQIHLAAPSVVGVSVPEAEARLKEIEDEILQQLHLIGERIAS